MRRKAFTLIELLVVIAIIAILAAILFPVFAQAKIAAKKATSISNINQFGKAMLLYASDYDDKYARADNCVANGSLNPVHNRPPGVPGDGCTSPPFAFRFNHYKWQAWLVPYTLNVQIFFHPKLQRDETAWRTNGEIMNGYALNVALTGALNTWGDPNRVGAYRNSFLGGTQGAIPDPASAMLFMEFASTLINYAPVFTTPSATIQTAYPTALRNLWAPMFMKWTSPVDCTPTTTVDEAVVPFAQGIIVGRADGSVKWMHVRQFLAETPTTTDYVVPAYGSGWQCGPTSGSRTVASAPVWFREWPLWALR
jgi:prepilin-type N-terminal cleavage/methylation domain-containing protein